jgi:two-component system NarL family response regulator
MNTADAAPRRIRVLCVDNHPIVQDGIAMIVNREPDMEVLACAATGQEAVELFKRHRPDVTLMDLKLGEMSGVQAIRAIRREDPQARIVVLTVSQSEEDIHQALEAGAITYLLKDTLSADLVRVIAEVHDGTRPALSDEIRSRIAERASHPELSYRELQILRLVAQGLRNREIAVALHISEQTVQVHVRNILSKLDAKDRTAAVAAAVRRGIIQISDS